jgi:hypothetical protein
VKNDELHGSLPGESERSIPLRSPGIIKDARCKSSHAEAGTDSFLLAMKLLDGDVLPGETVEVDGDLKKGTMTFNRAMARTARG